MTGPTETLVAQNLQDCKGYLVHTLNITMFSSLTQPSATERVNLQFTHTTECNRKSLQI